MPIFVLSVVEDKIKKNQFFLKARSSLSVRASFFIATLRLARFSLSRATFFRNFK